MIILVVNIVIVILTQIFLTRVIESETGQIGRGGDDDDVTAVAA